MNLNTDEWKEFPLINLFEICAGKYHATDEYSEGNTPYISASNMNNAVCDMIDLEPEFAGNCITTGKVGCTAFYQPRAFCATSDVNIFKPRFEMNESQALFIVAVLNKSENYKWSYGRQCRVGDSKEIIIKLPIVYDKNINGSFKVDENGNKIPYIDKRNGYSNEGYIPDFNFMEEYIKSLNKRKNISFGGVNLNYRWN